MQYMMLLYILRLSPPPMSTRSVTPFPYTQLFRSRGHSPLRGYAAIGGTMDIWSGLRKLSISFIKPKRINRDHRSSDSEFVRNVLRRLASVTVLLATVVITVPTDSADQFQIGRAHV